MTRFSPQEFVEKLATGSLPDGNPAMTVGGIVKANDADPSTLLFSTDLSCESWIPVPLSLIQTVEQIRTVNCKDHKHPLVKIAFTPPSPDQRDINALLMIMAGLQSQLSWFHRNAKSGSPWASTFASDCAVVSASEGLTKCCTQTIDGRLEVVCTGMV